MQLDETQRAKVSEWIKQGMKLSEVQNRLISEFGMKMTYMEVRLLVDDLKLTPVDPAPAPVSKPDTLAAPAGTGQQQPAPEPPAAAGVHVSVDQLTRPGALVSGKVVFSDGQKAEWYMDETGRLGIATQQQGYRPAAADIQDFQASLQAELGKLGL